MRTEDEAVAAAKRIGFPVVTKPLDGNHGRGVGSRPAHGARGADGVPSRPEGGAPCARGRGVLRDRHRLPRPRDRRPDGGHRRARARARRRRRPARRPVARGQGEPGPAAWHRPREGAHAHQDRRGRRGAGEEAGVRRSTTSRPRARRCCSPPPATCPRAASRSTAPGRRTRTTSRSPRRLHAWWASTSPASTSWRPTSPQPVRETGGAIVEVNAAPGFRMHTHPTEGEPQYVAKYVVDGLFPPGTPVADPDRGRHRVEREDDDDADDRAHPAGQGP